MRRMKRLLLPLLLTTSAWSQNAALKAGAAAVDITPQIFPLNMPGGFSANMAEKAHDPLHSRALVLSDDRTTLAMVVVDNLGAGPEVLDEVKSIAAGKTGIPVDKMLICSTHTHSGSSLNTRTEAAAAYRKLFVEGVADSIVQAHAALKPASVGGASHPLPDEVFNRRWYLKPGKMPLNPFGKLDAVKMNPGTSPDVLDHPAGPTDPDITVISVQDTKRMPMAVFANYSLHYVGGAPAGEVSADYYGEYARLMPSRLRSNGKLVAMMSNGTSGDINNTPFTVIRPPREPFEQIRIVAQKAADATWFALKKIDKHRADAPLEDALSLIVRERLTGAAPPETAKAMVDLWRPWIEEKAGRTLAKLDRLPENQEAFGRMLRDLLKVLDLSEELSEGEKEEGEDESEQEPESGDQNAAMAMAATYDPAVMNELGVRGVEADVQKARYWYQKASEYGSKEAPKRLESLASQSR